NCPVYCSADGRTGNQKSACGPVISQFGLLGVGLRGLFCGRASQAPVLLRYWTPEPPPCSTLISNFRSKSLATRFLYAMKECDGCSGVEIPTIAPSSTCHTLGSPSQPSRVLPSN